jgi:hypothetical protein
LFNIVLYRYAVEKEIISNDSMFKSFNDDELLASNESCYY